MTTPRDIPACITALDPSAREPGRVAVRVDGRPAATLSLKLAQRLGLAAGQPWTDELARQVRSAAEFDRALSQAAKWVGKKPRSKMWVTQRLQRTDWPAELRQQVLDRLVELQLIDDAALGRAIIEEWTQKRSAGPALLRAKLAQHGLAEALIDELLRTAALDDDAPARARAWVQKKEPTLRRHDAATRYRRLYGGLARRGFSQDVIEQVLGPAEEMDNG